MQYGLPFLGYQVSIRLPVQLRFCCRWDKKQGNSFNKMGGNFMQRCNASKKLNGPKLSYKVVSKMEVW